MSATIIREYLNQIDFITKSNLNVVDIHIELKKKLIERNTRMELLFHEKRNNNGKHAKS